MIFPLIVFTAIAIWSIHSLMKHQSSRLSIWKISLIFIYKLALGSAYGYIFANFFPNDDTWFIHQGGLEQTYLIKNDLKHFLYQLTPAYSWEKANHNIIDFIPRFLSDLEWNLLRKPLGILNIFSGGNYYVNLTFINFFSFWGLFWIYQIFIKNFPNAKNLLIILLFFLPTSAFWLSGLRSEPFLIFFFGLFLKLLWNKKKIWPAWYAWLGIAVLRIDLAFTLIPFGAALYWWLRDPHQLKKKILVSYGSFIALFIICSFIIPGNYPWSFIVEKQAAFFNLTGTRYTLTSLSTDFPNWISAFPQAIINTYLRPFLNEAEGIFQLITSLSQIIIITMIGLFLFMKRKPTICPPYDLKGRALLFNLITWTVLAYLFIGLIVPFPGAIVRYKIIAELILVTCVAMKWKSWLKPQIKTYYKK